MRAFSAELHGVEFALRACAPPLREYVGCFWTIRARRGGHVRVVPDGCTSIDVTRRLGQSADVFFSGPATAARERVFEEETIVGVRLNPGVAYLLLKRPIREFADRRLPFAAIAPEAPPIDTPFSPDEQIDRLERWLAERLLVARVDAAVAECITRIVERGGLVRVDALARECAISTRHLNRQFRKWIGYPVKAFTRIVRFQSVLGQFDSSVPPNAADAAVRSGFFDQAHLNRDAKRFSKETPARLASGRVADFSKTRCDDAR
jgi:AraC-like DNA-binding protein